MLARSPLGAEEVVATMGVGVGVEEDLPELEVVVYLTLNPNPLYQIVCDQDSLPY